MTSMGMMPRVDLTTTEICQTTAEAVAGLTSVRAMAARKTAMTTQGSMRQLRAADCAADFIRPLCMHACVISLSRREVGLRAGWHCTGFGWDRIGASGWTFLSLRQRMSTDAITGSRQPPTTCGGRGKVVWDGVGWRGMGRGIGWHRKLHGVRAGHDLRKEDHIKSIHTYQCRNETYERVAHDKE